MDRSRKEEFSSIFSYFLFYFKTSAKFLRFARLRNSHRFFLIFTLFLLYSNRFSFRSKLHDGSFDEKGTLIDFFLFFILFRNECQIPSIELPNSDDSRD